ncbi:MAG TPA: hypothetical protein PLD62_09930 [Candidatus Cloacimonadota bacterium]|nr:hypothetical protein [Candidatus Cloacimonadota bacterium]
MNIDAEITGIKYKILNSVDPKEIAFEDFNINFIPGIAFIKDIKYSFCITKWVSPKRTRSYPFERIYNSLSYPKKITVIPVVKDEGAEGDRDFIQWDTISLMSLMDVFVIPAYYEKAEKHPTMENKITNQKFSNSYVKQKIKEIANYYSSPLHWNLQEIKESFPGLIDKVKESYITISEELDVQFHNESGIEKFKKQLLAGAENFMNSSRQKAQEAQNREIHTIQPKEFLSSKTKAKITIKNYLGGHYFLTVDEMELRKDDVSLIECKHTKNSLIPSVGDIKDGLLKMVLYCNLKNVIVDSKSYISKPVLRLTSSLLSGNCSSFCSETELDEFCKINKLNYKQKQLVKNLFMEANENGFDVEITKVSL